MLTLYTYFRSSAAWRVRIALALKGLDYTAKSVHLLRDGGEQHRPDYVIRNPLHLVPALDDDGLTLTQSLAIIEYLDETHPQPPLLPATPAERARVRAIAQGIACDIHPLNNLRVLQHLEQQFGASAEARSAWYGHWIRTGFDGLEALLAGSPQTGTFCHGDTPGLADCCLVPQLFNARRFRIALDAWPTLQRIEAACLALPAFAQSAPDQQPDAE